MKGPAGRTSAGSRGGLCPRRTPQVWDKGQLRSPSLQEPSRADTRGCPPCRQTDVCPCDVFLWERNGGGHSESSRDERMITTRGQWLRIGTVSRWTVSARGGRQYPDAAGRSPRRKRARLRHLQRKQAARLQPRLCGFISVTPLALLDALGVNSWVSHVRGGSVVTPFLPPPYVTPE